MTAATIVAGLALALELGVTPEVAGQARAADLVTAARAQLGAGNVDSGLVLLGLVLDSGTVATERDRVNALVWRGVLQYFKGRDSLAHESFRNALVMDPRLEVGGLVQIDSFLAADFEAVRRSVRLPPTAQRPSAALARLAAGPPLDTVYSCIPECRGLDQPPRPALQEALLDHVRSARFSAGRVQGRGVRVVMQWRLTLRSR